jgi:predicted nucleic acid-binding protein
VGDLSRYDCSYYDGLYLALAEAARCPFVYADQRLRNTLAGRCPRAMWIEDYPG